MSGDVPDGGNCIALPAFAYDKYFLSNSRPDRFRAMVARAICANCVVRIECLEETVLEPQVQGTKAGKSVGEIRAIRGRMLAESGYIDPSLLTDDELDIEPPRAVWLHRDPRRARQPAGITTKWENDHEWNQRRWH